MIFFCVISTGKALTLETNWRNFFKSLFILTVAKDKGTRETDSKPPQCLNKVLNNKIKPK